MRAMRGLLLVVILLDLALIVVFMEARGIRLRYALAKKQEQIRAVAAENRKQILDVAKARRPEELARRAARFDLRLANEERGRRRP